MNGIVFIEIRKFAESRLGEQAWRDIVRLAGVADRIYYRVADYPDEEAVALLTATSAALQESVDEILRALGEFLVPDLIRISRYWIEPQWRTLDLIANTERTIHETLRSEGSQTNPPRLRCRRTGPDEVIITYDSPRRMCRLAEGIILGFARHYAERVAITQPSCMLKGAPACSIVVKRV